MSGSTSNSASASTTGGPSVPHASSGAGSQDAELERILAIATSAAIEAGGVLLEHFGHIQRADVGTKSSARDLVTVADIASERLLVERLRRAFPEHAIEAEEEVRDALDERLRWFLDPLDGTVNFVHGIPAFAVSIALYRGAEPLVGVVHLPRLGETFRARRGGGAWCGAERDAAQVRVSEPAGLGDAILATGFPYRRRELANDNVRNFERFVLDVRDMRRMGSAAMDLAYVAAGRLDGFWELHLAAHDVAAGALLVREAGGVVTDGLGAGAWLRGGSIVASGHTLAATIRARLKI